MPNGPRFLSKMATALSLAREAQRWTDAADQLLPRLRIFFVERCGADDRGDFWKISGGFHGYSRRTPEMHGKIIGYSWDTMKLHKVFLRVSYAGS